MLWRIPAGEMKEQVLPEDLLCLETHRDCGSGFHENDRTAETVKRGRKTLKQVKQAEVWVGDQKKKEAYHNLYNEESRATI